MQYLVLRGFVLTAGRAVVPGEVVRIEDQGLARQLTGRGCITPHTAAGAAPAPPPGAAGGAGPASAPGNVAVREPEPENREPRVTRRIPRG